MCSSHARQPLDEFLASAEAREAAEADQTMMEAVQAYFADRREAALQRAQQEAVQGGEVSRARSIASPSRTQRYLNKSVPVILIVGANLSRMSLCPPRSAASNDT